MNSAVAPQPSEEHDSRITLYLLCLYLLFEFGRIQDIVPGISQLYIPRITVVCLAISIFYHYYYIDLNERVFRLYICLLLLMVIHIPLAVNNFWAYSTTYSTLGYFIASFVIIFVVRDLKALNKAITFWTFTLVVLAIVGLLHGGGVPKSAYLADENDFALAMNLGMPFMIFRAYISKAKRTKIFWSACTGILMMGTMVSMSRGGFVGLIPVVLYCWLRLPRKVFSTTVGLIILLCLAWNAPKNYWSEMATIGKTHEGTASTRRYYWQMGWKMFLHNPVIGVGPGNFPWEIENYEPQEGFQGRRSGGRSAHSLYFTLLAELGTAGVVIFCGMIIQFFKTKKWLLRACSDLHDIPPTSLDKECLEEVRYIVYMLEGSVIAYLFTGIFLSVLYYPYFWILLAWCSALHLRLKEHVADSLLLHRQMNPLVAQNT